MSLPRKTFAIISHPDAGKTTLTEKLLLYGGAIHLAGQVKARKRERSTTSDWMEIERQRGISVTSSVLQFDFLGHRLNLLDTPGHKDFSEDTYRTLMAADSAVMLIDNAKGVEEQTKKLFEVCKRRKIPILTFVNKMDREGRDPLSLLDEIEKTLGIKTYPMVWPLGMGRQFKGVVDLRTKDTYLYEPGAQSEKRAETLKSLHDESLKQILDEQDYERFCEEVDLVSIASHPWNLDEILQGNLTPVFFGSAMTNFGVKFFLESLIQIAPEPSARNAHVGNSQEITPINPKQEQFTGFIFKIQANMDPQHRDRVAFLRVCSGHFQRGQDATHARLNKTIKLSKSLQFMANERVDVLEAWPGDVVGLLDTSGSLRLGDTLYSGKERIEFLGIPRFSPENFVRVVLKDVLKRKQFKKGLDQLTEEGVVQVFSVPGQSERDAILGAVGHLQFEVFAHRLASEYSVEVALEALPFQHCRWVVGPLRASDLERKEDCKLLEDRFGASVILFRNDWSLQWAQNYFKDLKFFDIAP